MNQNIIIFFPNDTVLWPLSMKSVPTEYGSKALCRIDWCDELPLGRARALGDAMGEDVVFETMRELRRPPSRRRDRNGNVWFWHAADDPVSAGDVR